MALSVALATCLERPQGSRSEWLFVEALERRGIETITAPWNGEQQPFRRASLVLLRGCWDYYKAPATFLDWIASLEKDGVRIANDPDTVRWNFDKSYLLDLQASGIRTPITAVVDPRDHGQIRRQMRQLGLSQAVLKPISGQSGHYLTLLDGGTPDAARLAAIPTDRALLQAFEADIGERGEVAMVFFAGRFSHAVRKVIRPGEWRANAQFGGRYEPAQPSDSVLEQASAAIRQSPSVPTYARVDGIVRDDSLVVMELELIEPGLYFDADGGAAERFADAVTRLLTAA